MATQQPPLKSVSRILGRVIVFVFFSTAGVFPTSALATDILLGTQAEGTFSHFAGRAVCRMINRHADGLDCQVVPAADRIHNLTNLQGGSLDMALVDTSMLYDAVKKKGYFAFLDILYDNLTAIAPVYDQSFVLVARADADIESLDGLKGKRINAGASRSATHQKVELILGAKGWTHADFITVDALPSSLSQDTMAFCHGSVQAMLHIGVHPDSGLERLINLCNAVPVDMDDADMIKWVQGHPAYSQIQIPATAYPALGRSISTFGVTVALVASGSLDNETVAAIMAVLDTNRQALQHAHPALAAFAVDNPLPDVGIPKHPGVAAYLSQR